MGMKSEIKRVIKVRCNSNKYLKSMLENVNTIRRRWILEKYQLTHDIDERLIVFEAFSGNKYACNPMAIYEELLKRPEFDDYEFVWIFNKPNDYKFLEQNKNTTVVKKFSKKHYKTYATAKYWVNNMSVPDYLKPGKGQVYLETWHGVPLKRMGFDIETDVDPRQTKSHMLKKYKHKAKKMSYMISSSEFYTEKLTSAFGLDRYTKRNIFINTGYPRNDFLFHYTEADVKREKEKLGIPENKKVILYTPTWRDTQFAGGKIVYQVELDLEKLSRELGDDYVILFRAHHHVKEVNGGEVQTGNVINVADIDEISELYIISDLLITDYSSTMFDFALLKRPMVFYMYDLDEYANDVRGFYFDISELPGPIVKEQDELADIIRESLASQEQYKELYEKFNEKFNQYNKGDSAKQVVDQVMCQPVSENYLKVKEKRLKRQNQLRESKNFVKVTKYNLLGLMRKNGLCLDENSRKLYELKNVHKGKRCFLVGNGPSLNAKDLDLLKDEISFGCNMVYKIFEQTQWRPTYYCAIDSLYAKNISEEMADELKEVEDLFTVRTSYTKLKTIPENMIYINNVFSENHYKVRGNVLAYCKTKATVMSLMAELAFYMGFEEIYLIGVDNSDTHGANAHFYQSNTEKLIANQDVNRIRKRMLKKNVTQEDIAEHTMSRCNSVYEELGKFAQKHDIKICNATRGGNLDVFPRRNLEDIF